MTGVDGRIKMKFGEVDSQGRFLMKFTGYTRREKIMDEILYFQASLELTANKFKQPSPCRKLFRLRLPTTSCRRGVMESSVGFLEKR